MKTITCEAGPATVVAGKYNATVARIEEASGQFGPLVKFYFTIFDAELGEIELSGICSEKLTPSTKLGQWLTVLRGKSLKAGEAINPESAVGCECEVHVENRIDKNDIEHSNVTRILKLINNSNSFFAHEDAEIEDEKIPF